VDVLIFTIAEDRLKIALIRRGIPPFRGQWAIPGGFVLQSESLEEAALREVREEAGIEDVFLEQLHTFGDPFRDPRRRVITVAYFALVSRDTIRLRASTDAADVSWYPVDEIPSLAFDHNRILQTGIERLRSRLGDSAIAAALLPATFRLTELQHVYEAILGQALDKRNFRKKILTMGLVEMTDELDAAGAHRPARLFRFCPKTERPFDI
jgi:8-oxo-dGTP diphosphatase